MVAEKSSVCLFLGRKEKICLISGMKPISSIRSASSTTNILTSLSIIFPFAIWSRSRPGVAMRTSIPLSSFCSCFEAPTPPMRRAEVNSRCSAYAMKFSSSWRANSRVVSTMRALGIRIRNRLAWARISIMGRRKAADFPVPVSAQARISRCMRMGGMTFCCMGVGFS